MNGNSLLCLVAVDHASSASALERKTHSSSYSIAGVLKKQRTCQLQTKVHVCIRPPQHCACSVNKHMPSFYHCDLSNSTVLQCKTLKARSQHTCTSKQCKENVQKAVIVQLFTNEAHKYRIAKKPSRFGTAPIIMTL